MSSYFSIIVHFVQALISKAIKNYFGFDAVGGKIPWSIYLVAVVWIFVVIFFAHVPEPEPDLEPVPVPAQQRFEEASLSILSSTPMVQAPEADPLTAQLPEIQLADTHASASLPENQPTEPPAQLREILQTESHETAPPAPWPAQVSEILPTSSTSSTSSSQESDPPAPEQRPVSRRSGPAPLAPPAPPAPPAPLAREQRPVLRRRGPAPPPPPVPPSPPAQVQRPVLRSDSKSRRCSSRKDAE